MSLSIAKRSIRTAYLRKRQQLSRAEVAAMSMSAQRLLLGMAAFQQAKVLALYSPIRNEVETALLLHKALTLGKTLCYPCVEGDRLAYYRIRTSADLRVGSFGVLEPEVQSDVVDAADIELLLIPGVAFDRRGHRLGYGRGYFDRFLMTSGFKGVGVGFCFEFQIVEKLPVEEHDQGVVLLVTNEQIYSPISSDNRVNHRLC